MHRHIAEMAVSLVANHRVVRQVALMYVCGAWLLISTEVIDDLHHGSHINIDDCELSEVATELDALVVEWREAGHDVRCHRRHISPALDAS